MSYGSGDYGEGAYGGWISGYARFAGPLHLGTSASTLYIVPLNSRAWIRNLYVNNPSGAEIEVTCSIGTDSAPTRILDQAPIAAGGQLFDRYHTLEAGETIQAFCDVDATAVIVIDGYVQEVEP